MYLRKIPQRKSVALKGIGNIVDKIKKSTETWICLEGNQTIFFFGGGIILWVAKNKYSCRLINKSSSFEKTNIESRVDLFVTIALPTLYCTIIWSSQKLSVFITTAILVL